MLTVALWIVAGLAALVVAFFVLAWLGLADAMRRADRLERSRE